MTLPISMAERADAALARLRDRLGDAFIDRLTAVLQQHDLLQNTLRVLAVSSFVVDQLEREGNSFLAELENGSAFMPWADGLEPWRFAISEAGLSVSCDEPSAQRLLRRFRNQAMLRLIWRAFSDQANLEETLRDLTHLAESCVEFAVGWATHHARARFGVPIGRDSGTEQSLIVLGMGKLGGGELNLSSDIDLIFAYPEVGETVGARKSLSNQEFFTRVGQSVIRMLDAPTAEGFVFRVDMRLRPYGNSGALVSSFDALESYYQAHGREWERYAMLKARALTGSKEAVAPLEVLLNAFVYRRFVDFGVLDALRDMSARIAAEAHRMNLRGDIKRGSGGIRQIEFIAQSLQLIHGGRIPELQVRGLEAALTALARHGLISENDREALIADYRSLRSLENALQGMADSQTHHLPDDALSLAQLAAVLGDADGTALRTRVGELRSRVQQAFDTMVAFPGNDKGEDNNTNTASISFAELDVEQLAQWGYEQPERCWQALETILVSPRLAVADADSRRRCEQFLPVLCQAAGVTPDPDLALQRTLPFVEAVIRRSAYLVLLRENPDSLALLLSLNVASGWIADKLASRPELLEELLHRDRLLSLPDRAEMRALVEDQLIRVPEDDLEAQLQAMVRVKEAITLRIAGSDVTGELPVMKVADNLTFLAEVLVDHALAIAGRDLIAKHGVPQGEQAGFAVVAYGKFGGIELSYGSDLDLVFVFEPGEGMTAGPKAVDSVRFFTRLAQRLVHLLSAKVGSGHLYEVDLRLRPNGDSGLIAVSFDAFANYQRSSAWTWEHQALLRARVVSGTDSLRERIEALRQEILCRPRDRQELAVEVADMRNKMSSNPVSQERPPEGWFHLKSAPGAIVDIEFLVQYLSLTRANGDAQLVADSDVINVLAALQQSEVLSVEQEQQLREAYLAFRSAVNKTLLQAQQPWGRIADYWMQLSAVVAIRDQWLPGLRPLPKLETKS